MSLALVIGGAGFIGSHTADALIASGMRVRILDALQPRVHPHGAPAWLPKEAEFVRGDAASRADLEPALDSVTHVLHFAAYQDYLPDFSTFIHVNVESTALLYELLVARRQPVEKVLIASSQAVYGEGRYVCPDDGDVYPEPRSLDRLERAEWDPACPRCGGAIEPAATPETYARPQNAYAVSKLAQETTALTLGRQYGIPTVAMRYSIVQGPRQSFHNAYSGACRIFCTSYFLGRRPVLYEDGAQLRDYVNIGDVVAANLLVLKRADASFESYNVGAGRAWSVRELAAAAAKAAGSGLEASAPRRFRMGDTRHIISDIRKLKALGWTPTRTIEENVAEYTAWLRTQDVTDALRAADAEMAQLAVVREAAGA